MADGNDKSGQNAGAPATPIIVQQAPRRTWVTRILMACLMISILINLALAGIYLDYIGLSDGPIEKFRSGDPFSEDKLAVLELKGLIAPPLTGWMLDTIDHIADQDDIHGVLLVIDSPGGVVADSHQIFHRLQQLREKKPVFVSMARLAASGGYYVAMGAGPEAEIYAEPTTWTGSIGVIIPRYDLSKLAEQIGVASDSLKTGPLKDSLNPLKEVSAEEREMWTEIMNESFERFKGIIVENRPDLTAGEVDSLATGRIFTANQAIDAGLVDHIGFEEDALAALQEKTGVSEPRVVTYERKPTLVEILLSTAESRDPNALVRKLLEAQVPQAMYLFGR